MTPQERRLQKLLQILSAIFGLAVLGYLLPALVGPLQPFFVQLPFVTNSVVKIGTLALLAFVASGNVRKFRVLTIVVILGHIISELAVTAVLLWGKTDYSVTLANPLTAESCSVPIAQILVGSMVMDGVIILLLVWFHRSADRAGLDLQYFSPAEFRCLKALAEVVIMGEAEKEKGGMAESKTEGTEVLSAGEVARNVDWYLSSFKGKSKWVMKIVLNGMQLYPLLSFKPPLSLLEKSDRLEFLKKRFYQDVNLRLVPPFWRMIVQGMIRMSNQLCYMGYYNDPKTFESVGYVPFSQRKDTPEKLKKLPPPPRKPLHVLTSSTIDGDTVNGDVVIIGSGAAASILAHGLAKAGREVLMIERGDHVDPSEFTENEVDMISRLYADGALQQAMDFRFTVLQGSCVGGTTVVNNAVCFKMPPHVLERWNDPQSLDAGLDEKRIWDSFDDVTRMIGVERQNHPNLNKGAALFNDGLRKLGLHIPPHDTDAVNANIHECLGCGYCNIGCKYGKKLSMLDTVLPETQREFNTPGRNGLRIIAGCEAIRLRATGSKITSVQCRFSNEKRVDVTGKTIVVAAGAISSSILLLRSRIGGKKAGKRLSFNMGSPITAVFKDVINSYEGLQISHYLSPVPSRGYLVETWFNPPMAQAVNMPGWFDDHFKNMLRYNRITCGGVLVGTEANAEVRIAGLTGREIFYHPTPGDLNKVLDGIVTVGEIFLAAGAECVMPATFRYNEFTTPDDLHRLYDLVKDTSDLSLGGGHPQGGNIISRKPELGVVNEEFAVHGYDNLFVCDASVFPSSIGVNPQLTVMALAHYAVPFIANNGKSY